jgi:hypothetical protein
LFKEKSGQATVTQSLAVVAPFLLKSVFEAYRRESVALALVELVLELNPVETESVQERFHQVHHHQDSDSRSNENEESEEELKRSGNLTYHRY